MCYKSCLLFPAAACSALRSTFNASPCFDSHHDAAGTYMHLCKDLVSFPSLASDFPACCNQLLSVALLVTRETGIHGPQQSCIATPSLELVVWFVVC